MNERELGYGQIKLTNKAQKQKNWNEKQGQKTLLFWGIGLAPIFTVWQDVQICRFQIS